MVRYLMYKGENNMWIAEMLYEGNEELLQIEEELIHKGYAIYSVSGMFIKCYKVV